jgi:hypothetical protein
MKDKINNRSKKRVNNLKSLIFNIVTNLCNKCNKFFKTSYAIKATRGASFHNSVSNTIDISLLFPFFIFNLIKYNRDFCKNIHKFVTICYQTQSHTCNSPKKIQLQKICIIFTQPFTVAGYRMSQILSQIFKNKQICYNICYNVDNQVVMYKGLVFNELHSKGKGNIKNSSSVVLV